MKKRMFSLFLALALCLSLLPATAWAAGETVPSNVTLAGTALESGKSYVATVDGITEKTGESVGTNYLTYDNGTLTVFGTVEVSCGESAGLSFYSGTLTLAGDGDLTIAASGSNSAVSGNPYSTLIAVNFSGDLTLGSVNAPAVQNVVLNLTTGGDILISSAKNSAVNTPQNPVTLAGKTVTIKGTDETTEASPANVSTVTAPKLNVTAEDGVTITGSSDYLPLIADDSNNECAVTLNAGGDVKIVNKGGMAVYGPLTVESAHNVTIGGGGESLLYSANGVHRINASRTVKMESSGIVCSGTDANGLTITGVETVDIAGESTSAPVVTGMTLNECGTATVTRLQYADTMAPIAYTVTSDIPVLLRNGSNDIEPQLLWDGEYYQKAAVEDVYMEPSSEAAVYYEAGDGYVMFSKTSGGVETGTANAVLLNASSTAPIAGNLAEVKVIGENSLDEIQSLDEVGTKVSFTGNGTLHTFFGGSVEPEIADSVAFHGLVCVMTTEASQEQGKLSISMNFTAYGTSDLPPIVWESEEDPGSFVVGTVSSKEAIVTIRLTVSEGATLTIPEEVPLKIEKSEEISCLTNHGTLINNSTVSLPDATPADIKGLRLTGSGLVQVPSGTGITYYTNEGVELGNHKMEDLDLSGTNADQGSLETDGYHWDADAKTLTLNGLALTGTLTLPDASGREIKIVMSKESLVNSVSVSGNYRPTVQITGSAPLTVQSISGDMSLTVAQGAVLNAMESINIGASGNTDSIITVNGTLTVKGDSGIRCGQMVIGADGTVNISGARGVAVFGVNGSSSGTEHKGAFQIANGGTFTADCTDYNVVVFTGGAEVTKENAETYLVLPDNYLPAGYSIRVVTGESGGNTHYAVTVAQKDADLTLVSEHITGAGGKMELKYQPTPTPDPEPTPDPDPMPGGGSDDSEPSYSILLTETKGGVLAVRYKYASKGDTVTITVTPDAGYELDALTAEDKNGKELALTDKGDGKYTFPMPGSQVTVTARFKQTDTGTENPFTDISKNDYFYDAVLWAVEEGVTGGTGGGKFSPNAPCTRAQMVTFLWRASGSPEIGTANPFSDVSSDAYYYDAVLWAAEQGITGGTGNGKFSPDAPCTRAQMATFLWRVAGSPTPESGENIFADVPADSWYAQAVQWAYGQKITNGTGGGKFSPDAICTRAQMVQMLKISNQEFHVAK